MSVADHPVPRPLPFAALDKRGGDIDRPGAGARCEGPAAAGSPERACCLVIRTGPATSTTVSSMYSPSLPSPRAGLFPSAISVGRSLSLDSVRDFLFLVLGV